MAEGKFEYLPAALAVGVPEMDTDHERLFGCLEALKSACLGSEGLPLPQAESLYQTLQAHCALEESLAIAAGVDFADHREKHRRMLLSIRRMLDEVEAGRADVFSLLRYIDYWFERHIVDADQGLANSLLQGADFSLQRAGQWGFPDPLQMPT